MNGYQLLDHTHTHTHTHTHRFPWSLSGKKSTFHAGAAGDKGLIPGSGRSSGGGHGNPLQYSFLVNPMDRGAWWITFHRITKSWTLLKRLRMHMHIYTHAYACV